MILDCCQYIPVGCCNCLLASPPEESLLKQLTPVFQAIIAGVNLSLAYYIFVYNRKKDNKQRDKENAAKIEAEKLHEQTIKLQWFKELVVQPKIKHLDTFYESLEGLKTKINKDNLSEDEILALNQFVKDEASKFRRLFTDLILHVEKPLYDLIKSNLDNLVTELTTAISNDEHKLTNPKTYEKEIGNKINYSRNSMLSLIYNFKGTTSN
jgi:hypothetical protein